MSDSNKINKRFSLELKGAVLLFLYYLAIALVVFSKGILSSECLFFLGKASLLQIPELDKIKIFGLTFPQVPFILTSFTALFKFRFGPILVSILGTSILFYKVTTALKPRRFYSKLYYCILATFLLHPLFVFSAISGTSLYASLLFFYLFIYNLLKFLKTSATYNVFVASLYFSLLVFSCHKFIWLILLLVPIIFLFTVETLPIAKDSFFNKLIIIFNTVSLRRRFANKLLALNMVLFALPLGLMVIYRLLNEFYTGSSNYYLDHSFENLFPIFQFNDAKLSYFKQLYPIGFYLNHYTLLKTFIIAPLPFFYLYISRNVFLSVLIFGVLICLVEFLSIRYSESFVAIQFIAVFILTGWALLSAIGTYNYSNFYSNALVVITVLQIMTGVFSFVSGTIADDKNYINALVSLCTPEGYQQKDDDLVFAKFVSRLPTNEVLLADDDVAYRIFAMTESKCRVITQQSALFTDACTDPKQYVNYILIPQKGSVLEKYSKLNHYSLLSVNARQVNLSEVLSNKDWVMFKVIK
ncbi:hypothetical protein DHW03_16325 [Pedobacter yonginense]|uniref:Glycosyltransferase RgtA/B/C/D-like domain-containing protein n=1 Tax=Pedobacter yonginense TaxID=651869 RepID=A0A317EM29_9SPHI|nr:hypothetical protein [Pedobacter yonginense]PWS26346.1 hypothetical protein DHW03_16325 [Pedobacter yonginense]